MASSPVAPAESLVDPGRSRARVERIEYMLLPATAHVGEPTPDMPDSEDQPWTTRS